MRYQNKRFKFASTNGKLTGISVINAERIIWKTKNNVSSIVHFSLDKYTLSLVTF